MRPATLTYGAETWTFTQTSLKTLIVTQRKMERSMLSIRLQEKKTNNYTDVLQRIAKLKWQWAGRIMRNRDDRWTKKTTERRPRTGKIDRGRWCDDTQKLAGTQGMDFQQRGMATAWGSICPEMDALKSWK